METPPQTGPASSAVKTTMISPAFRYPPVGVGMGIAIVATQHSAESSERYTSRLIR